ncbi:MAG: hypothetical protein ACREF9_09805, partial [Opitutaceae bacterium]
PALPTEPHWRSPDLWVISHQLPFAFRSRKIDVAGQMNDDACKTPSRDSPPVSAAGGSPAQKSGAVFNTITSDDWKRSLASARAQPNVAWQQIQTAISSQSPKTPTPSSS